MKRTIEVNMSKFDLSQLNIMSLTDGQKQILDTIKDLRLKGQMQGGLAFQDEAVLNDAIKKFQSMEEEKQDKIDHMIAEKPADQIDKIFEVDAQIKKALDGIIEELKKLPTDVRPLDEEFGENPRYAKYLAKNPPQYTVKVNRPPRKK